MPLCVIDDVNELQRSIGREIGISDWLEVTQPMIDAFAAVSRDSQWIHCDPQRAQAESPYGTTIAHGYLTLSLLSHLLGQTVRIRGDHTRAINYGLNRVRFPSPVSAGSRIRARVTPRSVEEIPGGVHLCWHVTVEVEGQDKPALVAESLVRLYR